MVRLLMFYLEPYSDDQINERFNNLTGRQAASSSAGKSNVSKLSFSLLVLLK